MVAMLGLRRVGDRGPGAAVSRRRRAHRKAKQRRGSAAWRGKGRGCQEGEGWGQGGPEQAGWRSWGGRSWAGDAGAGQNGGEDGAPVSAAKGGRRNCGWT